MDKPIGGSWPLRRERWAVSRAAREARNGHRGAVIWFTGLSGAGKSTLARALELRLEEIGCHTYVLDGDNLRHGLCADLGFAPQDRRENLRRAGEVAKLFVDAGTLVLAAFISPYAADREALRERIGTQDFIEVYCRCPLATCEARDVKGLYRRARAGEIADFTGISAPYEEPCAADLVLDTAQNTIASCVTALEQLLMQRRIVCLGSMAVTRPGPKGGSLAAAATLATGRLAAAGPKRSRRRQ